MKESTLRIRHGNVCAGDEFAINSDTNIVRHVEHGPREYDDIVGAWALATWNDQRLVVHVDQDETREAKKKSPTVWRRYPHVCARKLVVDKMIAELKRLGVWD